MKKAKGFWLIVCVLFLVPHAAFAQQQWSQGYWTPWGNPTVPPSEIEWGGLTHVVDAWALVRADGSLDLDTQLISSQGPVLVANAHAHGVKALLGVGQPYWLGQTGNFQSAITTNRSALVSSIMNVVNTYGFDGVDLDWEPFNASTNGGALQAFAADLRAQLGTTKTLSVAAIVGDYTFWGTVHSYFDRIGVMTYDLTGTWNPYSWHNSALYDTDGMVWSIDLAVKRFTTYGVPASKLSIGIPFFGYRWSGGGVTGPRQTWISAPNIQQIYYQSIVANINSQNLRWDASASVPYLSMDDAGTSTDQFWTYDNEQSIAEKVRYAESRGLGGWIIWELSGDYFPNQSPSQPLLLAIKNTKSGGPAPSLDTTPPTVTINQADGQADPTGSLPVNFTVVFSEPVTGFTASDVTIGGTAPGSLVASISGSGATYNVAISGFAGSGSVVALITAGVVTDAAGNPNTASASTDNIVNYVAPDTSAPSVTIDQASSQADPVSSNPVYFTVVFSESVNDFTGDDVAISGTAPGTKTATVTGSGSIYTVAVSGVSGAGTVIATIPAGIATDTAGNPNLASSSTDNSVTISPTTTTSTSTTPTSSRWSMGYWTPWGNPPIAPADIEWGGLTHVVDAWALVRTDGTLDLDLHQVSSQGPALIAAAHAHGVKVLLGVSQPYWLGQTSNLQQAATSYRATLVNSIMSVVNSYGFDGVQLDWRPFDTASAGSAMGALASDLRASLGTRLFSASAIVTDSAYWATIQGSFDRIGIQTHDLTGTWNPYSWHNAALYDSDGLVWSVDLAVGRFTGAGVSASRLMIGIPFYGYQWTGGGITGPRQYWSSTPSIQQLSYQTFAPSINSQTYRQDTLAKVPYLSVDSADNAKDSFLTFDDSWSVREKTNYAINKGLGGWMVWELSADYLPNQSPNQPLLAAIRDVIGGTASSVTSTSNSGPAGDTTRPSVTISQAVGQLDPTRSSPIHFTAIFSEPVVGFDESDVVLSGMGGLHVAVTGSGTTYDVAVEGMTSNGTITASVNAGAATDSAGNPNTASTSDDNSVRYRKSRWPIF